MNGRQVTVDDVLYIGKSLCSERDSNKLFWTILDTAMTMTNCDGGTLYVLNGDQLEFRIMVTRSLNIKRGVDGEKIDLPPVKLNRENVCALSAVEHHLFNIPDVYDNTQFDFSGPHNYDELTGYHTHSMLVTPMEDDRGEVIGVMQLINAMDVNGNTIPFDSLYHGVLLSLASQAATRMTNLKYSQDLIDTLNSFVKVMSIAVDVRTPYNANHTRNMVKYAERFLDYLDKNNSPFKMDYSHRNEFLMAVWLHDIGKIVIPLEIMNKEDRLGSRGRDVKHRFEVMQLQNHIDYLEGRVSKEESQVRDAQLLEGLDVIATANNAAYLTDEMLSNLDELREKTWLQPDGTLQKWLNAEEYEELSVRKSTLTPAERQIMQSHVLMTEKMLTEMRFTADYANVPAWASAHHEFLNGTGYPHHLTAEQIPTEVRLLTILDIFDALTSKDRPYKLPTPAEKAIAILWSMEKDGQIDGELLALFEESRSWEEP